MQNSVTKCQKLLKLRPFSNYDEICQTFLTNFGGFLQFPIGFNIFQLIRLRLSLIILFGRIFYLFWQIVTDFCFFWQISTICFAFFGRVQQSPKQGD